MCGELHCAAHGIVCCVRDMTRDEARGGEGTFETLVGGCEADVVNKFHAKGVTACLCNGRGREGGGCTWPFGFGCGSFPGEGVGI